MNKIFRRALKGLLFDCDRAEYDVVKWLGDPSIKYCAIREAFRELDNSKEFSVDQIMKLVETILLLKNSFKTRLPNHDIANPISSPMNIDLFEKKRLIGSGGFGVVYLAINSEKRALCAIKELYRFDDRSARGLHKEIEHLSQLQHPNIIEFYGSKIVESQVSLYMEYVPFGSLKTYIEFLGPLAEIEVQIFMKQILSGWAFLHSREVVHRDIKPGNLLVDSQINIKIADFGLAKRLTQSVDKHSVDGTLYYAAPEVIMKKDINSHGQACAADIWSLGCVVIEMLTGKHPFPDCSNGAQVVYKVCVDNQDPAIPENLSFECKDVSLETQPSVHLQQTY